MPTQVQISVPLVNTTLSSTSTTQRLSLKGVAKVTVFCKTTGSWAFSVTVSPDNGTTEAAYNKIVPNATVAAGAFTRVASVTINNTTDCFTLPIEYDGDAFESFTVTGTRTGGNWTSAFAVLEYY